jgi:hypothetical protein
VAAIGHLVIWPLGAYADVGVGLRQVPAQVTVTVEREYRDFVVFILEGEPAKARSVSPTPSTPLVLRSKGREWNTFVGAIYVVPKTEVAKLKQAVPPTSWFELQESRRYLAGSIVVRTALDVFDDREQIERTYALRSEGDVFRLELLAENRGKPRGVRWVWGGVCCGLPLSALALTGWLLVRSTARRSRARP